MRRLTTDIEKECNKSIIEFAMDLYNPNGYVEFYGSKMNYKKMFQLADNLACNLVLMGIKKGDVVTLMLPNCPQFPILIYALTKIGAIVSMISPLISKQQADAIIQKTESKYVVASTLCPFEFDDITFIKVDFAHFAGLPARVLFALKKPNKSGIPFENMLKKPQGNVELPTVNPKEIAFFLNSGGTTGEPKTVMLSQYAVNSSTYTIAQNLEENDFVAPCLANAIYILPMFYGYGLVVFHSQLICSFNQVMRTKFNAESLSKDISKHDVAIMFGVPTMYRKMLQTGLFNSTNCNNLKVCYVGGEKLSEELEETFLKAFPHSRILEGYGMTEAVSAFVSQTKKNAKKGSCGKVPFTNKIEAFDGEKLLPRGEGGEICITTRAVMNGYYKDPENTKLSLFEYQGETWLRTGDFGYVDQDDFVFLSGRIKNIIKRKGINIFPVQIERCILKLDYVKEVAVFGFKDSQEVERIICAVVPSESAPQDLETQIKAHVKQELSVLCLPEYFLIKDKLPTTTVGKIDTKVLTKELIEKYGVCAN